MISHWETYVIKKENSVLTSKLVTRNIFSFLTLLTLFQFECVHMPMFVLIAKKMTIAPKVKILVQCREGLILPEWWSFFLQSRYWFSQSGGKDRLKLDCKFEDKYIRSTCFAREVIFVEDLQKFLPWNIQTASFFGDWSTPMKKNYGSKLTENNALWWLICTWEIQKVPVKIAYIQHLWRTILSGIFGVVVILFDVTLEKAETWKPGTAHSTGIKYWQVFSKYFNEEKW